MLNAKQPKQSKPKDSAMLSWIATALLAINTPSSASPAAPAAPTLFAPRPPQELSAELKNRIDTAVTRLGDASAKIRREARKEIEAMGVEVLPHLRTYKDKAEDVEVKDALREIIEERRGTVPWNTLSPAEQNFIIAVNKAPGQQPILDNNEAYRVRFRLYARDKVALLSINQLLIVIPDAQLAAKASGEYASAPGRTLWNEVENKNNVIVFSKSGLAVKYDEGDEAEVLKQVFKIDNRDIHLFHPDGSYRGRLVGGPP
jgi:hypothetical protein